MRLPKVALFVLVSLGLLFVGFCWVLPRILFYEIHRKEAKLTSEAVALAAGRDMAQLCQTCREHPEWFSDESTLSPAWAPQSVLKFNPSWVEVTPEGAWVEFGGGFYHFGYSMELESPPTESDSATTWILNFYSQRSQTRELGRFALTPDDSLTEEQFVDRTMAELDRRIAGGHDSRIGGDDDAFASVQRCKFAIKHKQIPRLQRAIRDTARQNPDAWRDVLFAYVIDFPTDPEGAAARLRQWADSKDDFSAWLMAAYAFDKVGELDAAEEAVQRACKFPANDPPWASMHARARAYSMCSRLYLAGRYESCVALCENLLEYNGGGDYMADSIRAIRDACHSARTTSKPASSTVVETDTAYDFDPFAGIEISLMRATGTP
ncbi:MAG: hypothetical protein IID33_13405 [Planctomycetes bacterium]|nr:hypothetical protein [Planctomycetota bacterium]